jgi:hypothetical protein
VEGPAFADAPNGFVELLNACWHPAPSERPEAKILLEQISELLQNLPAFFPDASELQQSSVFDTRIAAFLAERQNTFVDSSKQVQYLSVYDDGSW